jgi:hypothetical protein
LIRHSLQMVIGSRTVPTKRARGKFTRARIPGPGAKVPISAGGGIAAKWSRNGREMFYRSGDKMMTVDIQTIPTFRAGTPKVLSRGKYSEYYEVSADGRFLMVRPPAAQPGRTDQITVVVNWFGELRRRVPGGN